MNKNSFINKLKKNLKILDEDEVKDIIDEYSETIDEKIKDGKTEEEAIKDFGNVDELCKEILKAYKINPKYTNEESKFDFNEFIKSSADKLSDFTQGIINEFKKQDNISLEYIFEILIKAVVLLFIFAIISIPFLVVYGLGHNILDIIFFPFDIILTILWGMLVWLLYFVVCVLISIKWFKTDKVEVKKAVKKKKKVEIKEEKKEIVKKEDVTSVLKEIAKIFIFIFIVLPLIFVNLGIAIAVCFIIYYLIIGFNLFGVLLILLSLLIFFGYITNQLSNLFSKKISFKFYPFLLAIILFAIGTILFFNTFKNFQHIKYSNDDVLKYNYILEKHTDLCLDGDYETIIDNDLDDNEIVIEVFYNESFVTINESKSNNKIILSSQNKDFINWYNDCIANLKENKIIDYDDVFDLHFIVYGNRHTIDDIDIK